MPNDTTYLRKLANAVYLVADLTAAEDIAAHLNWAANEIERLRAALKECTDDLAIHLLQNDADITVVIEARKLLPAQED